MNGKVSHGGNPVGGLPAPRAPPIIFFPAVPGVLDAGGGAAGPGERPARGSRVPQSGRLRRARGAGMGAAMARVPRGVSVDSGADGGWGGRVVGDVYHPPGGFIK